MRKEDNDNFDPFEDSFPDSESQNSNTSQKGSNNSSPTGNASGNSSGTPFSPAFQTGKKGGNFPGATSEQSSRFQNNSENGKNSNSVNSNPNSSNNNAGDKDSAYTEALYKDQADLARALEEAKSKSEENWSLFLRTRADMDNYRRRSEIDIENARKYALERFARELLSVVDSLEHGLSVAESEHDSAYREGMTLTLKLLIDIFDKFNIREINPKAGDSFDPNLHEAISMQPSRDYEPNKVLMVAQRGFTLQERLLRPARVIVSKAMEG